MRTSPRLGRDVACAHGFQSSSAIAMSQANACGLKAALGHVFVSPSQATGNMTMLMITTDGRMLSYDVSGAGAPIVFVAGLGERGTYWTAQVAAFSSAFQVVTFDHRGVGASEGQPPYKVGQWAADTLRLIDHLRSRPSASGRTFDRGYHCASTRSRSLRSCRVPRPRRNLGAARRAIAQAVRFPQASALRAGGF
jgi:hypothetical protein